MTTFSQMKRKASGLKQKFTSRFRTKQFAENAKERDVRPLLKIKKENMTPWDDPEQLLTLNMKTADGKNRMSNFATLGSSVIATTFSDDTQSTNSSDLYRQQRSPMDGSRIVHPVVCKRDIYIGLKDDVKSGNVTRHKGDNRESKDPGGRREATGHWEPCGSILEDFQNENECSFSHNVKISLPLNSMSASMLCASRDNGGKVVTFKKRKCNPSLMSPPKPRGISHNTIMASMLFRTLGEETKRSPSEYIAKNETENESEYEPQSDEEVSDDSDDDHVVPQDVSKHRECAESSVSSVTMYSSYHNDPVVRASTNLYNILRSNHFGAMNNKPVGDGLFEA